MSLALGSVAGTSLATAATGTDRSDVVLVFDVSNSILFSTTGTNTVFADALDGIADRVGVVSADLAAGNAHLSFVVFGRQATTYPAGCRDLALHANPTAIARFQTCLRTIAAQYRAGPTSAFRQVVNTNDTDHVAALDLAASLLPKTPTRSAVVFFTDGKNDPPGTANDHENVVALATPAFAGISPLAVLPVGLGAGAGAFESELHAIYTAFLRNMQPCTGQPTFAWPQVVFPSADAAGTAVALALQEVTCSFTVAPTAAPSSAPTATSIPTPSPTEAPTTPRSTPIVTSAPTVQACTGGLLDCNPWLWFVIAGVGIVAVLGGAAYFVAGYRRRNRVWISAQVDGGENRSLGWGPELGIRLVHEGGGWFASALPSEGAPLRVRFEQDNRFMVTVGTRISHVHQGDPTSVRDDTGGIHQLILRRYRDRPNDRHVTAEARPPAAAPDSAAVTGRLPSRDDGED